MRDRLSALSAIALLVVLAAASYWYSVTAPFAGGSPVLPDKPDFIAKDLTVTQFDAAGKPKNRIFAATSDHYPDDRVVSTKVEMVTLASDTPQTRASADRGESFNGGQKAVFTGNVKIVRTATEKDPETVFTTTTLTAYPDTETFVTKAPVHMVKGGDSTDGTGMVYRHAHMKVRLDSQVTSVMTPRHKEEKKEEKKEPAADAGTPPEQASGAAPAPAAAN